MAVVFNSFSIVLATRHDKMMRAGVFVVFAAILCELASVGFASDVKAAISCGSLIKLRHSKSGRRLHSHEVQYGSGSGQQSVTGFEGPQDQNSFWIVKGGHGGMCQRGKRILPTSEPSLSLVSFADVFETRGIECR